MPGTTANQIKNDPTSNLDPAHPTIIGTFNPNLAKNTDQTIITDTDNNDSNDTPAY